MEYILGLGVKMNCGCFVKGWAPYGLENVISPEKEFSGLLI